MRVVILACFFLSGASGLVSKVVNDFLGKSGMSSLKDQFLLH